MLRRALFRARLNEEDVAAHLGVDPKTVRRWLEGRVPYPRHRQAVSRLVEADESDLWPEIHAARVVRSWPEEIKAVYPHQWAVPHEVWQRLFESAEHEIGVLAHSSLFIAEDVALLAVFAGKARAGASVRIALWDPDSPRLAERGAEDSIGDTMAAEIRNALALYGKLRTIEKVEIRLHRITLYNSLYYADDEMIVHQHIYGIDAVNEPVMHLYMANRGELFSGYIDSFEAVWSAARPG